VLLGTTWKLRDPHENTLGTREKKTQKKNKNKNKNALPCSHPNVAL
jgi:hypothetical protein